MNKFFFLIVLIWSCEPRLSRYNYPVPTLQSAFRFVVSKKVEQHKTNGTYKFLYIGKYADTLHIDHFLHAYIPPVIRNEDGSIKKQYTTLNSLKLHSEKFYPRDTFPRKPKLSIFVDTTQLIDNIFYNIGYKAYPVMIMNIGTGNASICLGEEIPLFLEAKDSLGNWWPIEDPFFYFCGVGLESVVLPPKEIAITSIPVYDGNYNTKLRLRFGHRISNEFFGRINYSQIEKRLRFNNYGSY